ncbi:hypothetical protein [Segniliparus rugosus]|uniref:Uncharacterized protein n=1 Tax=Segniliparus rugosus (strain ATCC BAA-974 / DSM 45345 / CCUG 50838 / CIP 108380 / JCM 13579 / CDC 945) TaxID=679197 RepID=E5XQV3_SEGRC|nr:hypothetical protein [Segniliparus rugosus]EFV13288.1 hypothetical protein HMPREF9336_01875 [Segniliparus rugosus ATCC BAA-974]
MGRSGAAILGGLCAAALAGPAPLVHAAPASASCAAVNTMDDLLGDIHFDLDNLRVVLNNVYVSPDVKKHDEEFRIKTLINAVGRLKNAAEESGSAEARQAAADVGAGFEDLKSAIGDQFVVVEDGHYDIGSSMHYSTPRLTGGTPASPEAYGAVDSMDDQRQAFADVVDGLRGSAGCAERGDDEAAPDEPEPQCRFHPGSFQCDATGSILH